MAAMADDVVTALATLMMFCPPPAAAAGDVATMYTGDESEAPAAEPGLGRIRAAVAPAGIIFMPAGASLSWIVVVEGDFGCCCWMTAAAVGRDLDVATEAADIT